MYFLESGKLFACGDNSSFALGTNTEREFQCVPIPVHLEPTVEGDIIAFDAGGFFSYAVKGGSFS